MIVIRNLTPNLTNDSNKKPNSMTYQMIVIRDLIP